MNFNQTGEFLFARDLAEARGPALELKRLEERQRHLEKGIICALSMLLDLKELDTGLHATRLAAWAVRVAERMGLPEKDLQAVETASVLHDVGKIGVPNEILLKPGRLTDEEFTVVKKHSEYGWAILRNIPGFERISLLVLHHHERWDGRGYPSGLRGEEIPLGARIVAMVDTFDAMLSDRPYRKGMPLQVVLEKLSPEGGHQFDPEVLSHFLELAAQHVDDIAQIREPAA
jgi:HD-GYP domain-containing protein (c-di-GMP phosphodiesterase class II)